MVKIEVDIPKAEYDILVKVAERLGLPVETLFQQQVDRDIEDISCWMQRATA